jgi:hypothetical protein
MNLTTFQQSINSSTPPAQANVYLQALWYEAKGDWDKAHELIQDLPDKNAAWIHAYLHRQEGDTWNADYWYRRAGRKRPQQTLQEEWESITTALLEEV